MQVQCDLDHVRKYVKEESLTSWTFGNDISVYTLISERNFEFTSIH